MATSSLAPWMAAARPKTLAAAVIPVLVGSAFAYQMSGAFAWMPAIWCLVFALLVQIGTNYANDYYDFVKGADQPDRQGPERAVASGRIAPASMRRAAFLVFAIAFLCGLNLVAYRGWGLLPLGIACILFGIVYTGGRFALAYHGLGDVFVVVFFGFVAVGGTVYVLAGRLDASVALAALPVGLLATNILVVNNYRDMDTDARAGKRTLVVRCGRRFAWWQYALSFAASLVAVAGLAVGRRSAWVLLPWLATPLVVPVLRQLRVGRTGRELNPLLGRSAQILLLFGLLLSAGLLSAGR